MTSTTFPFPSSPHCVPTTTMLGMTNLREEASRLRQELLHRQDALGPVREVHRQQLTRARERAPDDQDVAHVPRARVGDRLFERATDDVTRDRRAEIAQPPREGQRRGLVPCEVDDEEVGPGQLDGDALRLHHGEDTGHVEGEADRRAVVAEARQHVIVPPTGGHRRAEARHVRFEVGPGVVVEAPHLPEVEQDRVCEPVDREEPVHLREVRESLLRPLVAREARGAVEHGLVAEERGQRQQRLTHVRVGCRVAHEPLERGGILARERRPELAHARRLCARLLAEPAEEVGVSEVDLEALEPERAQPLDRHRDDLDLGLRLLEPDQLDARLVELAVVRYLRLVVAEHVGHVPEADGLGLVPEPRRHDPGDLRRDVGAEREHPAGLAVHETGRMLALRADITPQIARIVATRLRDEPKPIRLGYVTNVFRYDEPQVSHYREFYQAGVELIGLEKPEAEVEIIAMAIEGLRALGLERFQIDLGHPDFFRGLCEETGAEPARVRELRAALARKDASALERLVSDSTPDAHVREALLALPTLFGHEAVLDRAAGLARNKRSAKALANLAEVYRLLTIYGLADAILLDLGEVRGFDYYSGTYFEAYVSGFGASVAAGGRYDHMLARFGYDCAAVGFAFDVARVLSVMETQGVAVELPGPDFFIIDFTRDKTAALSLARRLRDLGASVARDIISRALEESVAYARARHVRHVLIVGSPLTGSHQLLAMDLADGSERVLAVAELLAEPGRFFTEIGHA